VVGGGFSFFKNKENKGAEPPFLYTLLLNLSIGDLQMLLGRDGQLYVIDPLNIHPLSSEILNPSSQQTRKNNIEDFKLL
jgi:hypothetical protein